MEQSFSVGNTIYLKHSNESAEIIRILDNETLEVETDDGIVFPVYISEVFDSPQKQHTLEQHSHRIETHKTKQRPKISALYIGWNFLYDGPEILFEPIIINGDSRALHLQWDIYFHSDLFQTINIHLLPYHFAKCTPIPQLLMNHQWKIKAEGQYFYTDGSNQPFHASIKIKPNMFSQELEMDPALQKRLIIQEIRQDKSNTTDNEAQQLKDYTSSLQKLKQNTATQQTHQRIELKDIHSFATFDPVLDLHLESLVEDPHKISGKQAIEIQLKAMREYITLALRIGIPSIFIIHGIGKGILRNKINLILDKHPAVANYRNDHHPRYGFGATEIFFQ